MAAILPQELVDTVIDYLHDDHPTLRACARVSTAWLPSSRRHLFARICFKATSPTTGLAVPEKRCERLYKLLQRTPEIVPYIRELEICEGSPLHHYDSRVQGSTTWVTTERSLAALFRLLTNVRRFEFAATSTLYWALLPPTFQNALCTLLAQPSLRYLRLHSWMFPSVAALTGLLSHCTGLRAFALSSTNVSGTDDMALVGGQDDGEQKEAAPPRAPLEVLTLDFVTFGHLENWLLGPARSALPDIQNLRELRVAHFHNADTIKRLLRTVGGGLEHFHLKPGTWDVTLFDLSCNPSLRSIRLTLDDPETAIGWATALLTTIDSANSALRSIGLEFYTDPKKIPNWAALDELLARPELAALTQVEIGLFANPSSVDFIAVKEEMRGLRERGVGRWYQLGVKSQKSSRHLTPRISQYEA